MRGKLQLARVFGKRVSHPQSSANNHPEDQDDKAKLGKALSRLETELEHGFSK